MTRKTTDIDIDNAIKNYVSGDSAKIAAARWNTGEQALSNLLKAKGLFRSKAERYKIQSDKFTANHPTRIAFSIEDVTAICTLYNAGVPEYSIAKQFSISRGTTSRILRENGITRRGCSDAGALRFARMSETERKAAIQAAQDSQRGVPKTNDFLVKRANGIERMKSSVSASEKVLFDFLLDRGVETIPQKAVGIYNLDLAVFPVGIEIFGGFWHASKPKHIERTRYILDQGWNMIFIWSHYTRSPIQPAAADYVVSWLDELRCHPSHVSQYRVVRGDGQELTRGSMNDDNITIVPKGFEGCGVGGHY